MFLVLLVSLYPLEESQLQLVITKRIAWYIACYSVHSVSDRLSWIVSYLDWCRLHHTVILFATLYLQLNSDYGNTFILSQST